MANKTHLIADEKLGGIIREYVEVERKADVGDYVVIVAPWSTSDMYYAGDIFKVEGTMGDGVLNARVATSPDEGNSEGFISRSEYHTLEPTDIVQIDVAKYRMVERNAEVGETVVITVTSDMWGQNAGDIAEVTGKWPFGSGINTDNGCELYHGEYAVLEPVISAADEPMLVLSETDIVENPRKAIDMIANLALRITHLEAKVAQTDAQVSRLAVANEQAVNIVARNVETLARDIEKVKHANKPKSSAQLLSEALDVLTAIERREL